MADYFEKKKDENVNEQLETPLALVHIYTQYDGQLFYEVCIRKIILDALCAINSCRNVILFFNVITSKNCNL